MNCERNDPDDRSSPAWRLACSERDQLVAWLFDKALPLWWTSGTDHAAGGYFEKIDRRSKPLEEPRRTRVVGRQIYVFATAKTLGWTGPADEAVAHGIDFFRRCCLAPDGTAVSTCRPDGTSLNSSFDLYDQAFAMFGLAAAFTCKPDRDLEAIASRMLDRMRSGWRHPESGFEESNPRSLPLRANPHMHIFEASLAWMASGATSSQPEWCALADEIGQLCLRRFIDSDSGVLRELYDGDWKPMPGEAGRIVEPGHMFEWAWLLHRWGGLRGDTAAVAAGRRLVQIAETHGIDAQRGVAFNELWDDLTPKDRMARLWPQTERIKAWLSVAHSAPTDGERNVAFEHVALAARGLRKYLAEDVLGAWNERMREDGTFLDEPAPASSLYHVTCAIAEMCQILPLFAPSLVIRQD